MFACTACGGFIREINASTSRLMKVRRVNGMNFNSVMHKTFVYKPVDQRHKLMLKMVTKTYKILTQLVKQCFIYPSCCHVNNRHTFDLVHDYKITSSCLVSWD